MENVLELELDAFFLERTARVLSPRHNKRILREEAFTYYISIL